jgi:uncharacterized protein (DUF427 family)
VIEGISPVGTWYRHTPIHITAIPASRRNHHTHFAVGTSMAKAHEITVTPAGKHIEVTLDGETLAVSDRAVVLNETGLRPRYYFPREDVRMDLMKPTSTESTCPFKGQASYWSIAVGDKVYDDLVWSYETPIPRVEGITGLLCFWEEKAGFDVAVS